jgi:TonB-linked SusC/RagA family outer membrane protein
MQVFATGKTSALGRALHQLNCFFPKHRQAVRIMKLTTILLLAACLQLSARGISQTISISVKDAPLLSVLKAIEKQTDFVFIVDNQWLQKTKKVTITATNLPLLKVLELCFKDQPLTYNISGKVIVISPKEVKAKNISAVNEEQQGIDVRGRVVNENGEPVQASVTVKGTKEGTTTNANGEFRLQNVDENAVLVISGVGIEERELKVAGKTNLYAVVKIAVKPLDEVQMIAYGTTTRRYSTGNISSVKASDIEKQPVNNPLLALEGRVPGLVITQSSGVPGTGITVRIQGQNSILGGNDPLYVIDGVPYPGQMLITTRGGATGILGQTKGSLYSTGGSGNPLSYINPDDIESIEVLKDADATSIYGSRAANGAILITTKQAKGGKTKVDVNMTQGWGKVTREIKMMNTEQYIQMRKEASKNDNITILPTDANYDINGLWDTTRYTDWVKTLIGGTAKYTNINGVLSGGNANTNYLIGTTYHDETSVFPGNFEDQKESVHFNVNSVSNNQKFRIQLTANYVTDNNRLPYLDLTTQAYTLAPDAPSLFNADGTLNWASNSVGNSSWTNPLAQLSNKYQNKTDNLIGSTFISYKIIKGLEISTRLGYNKLETKEIVTNSLLAIVPERRQNSNRSAEYTSSTINTYTIEPQVDYKATIGNGRMEILLGTTIQNRMDDGQSLLGSGQPTEESLSDIRSATTVTVNSSVEALYKYNAAFGRLNYAWKDKYIFDFNTRRDGSSHFGPKNRFHNFASVGAAWIFTQENFFKSLPFVSFGKLKASYGSTGNDQIGDYTYMDLYATNNSAVPYQGSSSITVTGIPSPYLQWEETRKLSLGIDLGFWRDRVLLSATYAKNKSSNQLLSYALPIITGFTSVNRNFPATVQNTSLELSLSSININNKDFKWNSNLNFTVPTNKLIAFPDLENSSYSSYLIIGKSVNIVQAYHFLGVDPTTGIYTFADKNGNSTSTPSSDDRTVVINVDPKFYGGFENSFTFKGFQLAALFQFAKQMQSSLAFFAFGNVRQPGFAKNNQPVSVINHWQKPGDMAYAQRYSSISYRTQFSNASQSDAGYVDASFIRLKNLSFSYNIPNAILKSLHLRECSLRLEGQNLLTITNFKGVDPENQSNSNLPPLRIVAFGFRLGL